MDGDVKPILCGKCDAPIKVPADPKPNDIITCACGNSDTFEGMMNVVHECIKEQAALMLQKGFEGFNGPGIVVKRSGPRIEKTKRAFYVELGS